MRAAPSCSGHPSDLVIFNETILDSNHIMPQTAQCIGLFSASLILTIAAIQCAYVPRINHIYGCRVTTNAICLVECVFNSTGCQVCDTIEAYGINSYRCPDYCSPPTKYQHCPQVCSMETKTCQAECGQPEFCRDKYCYSSLLYKYCPPCEGHPSRCRYHVTFAPDVIPELPSMKLNPVDERSEVLTNWPYLAACVILTLIIIILIVILISLKTQQKPVVVYSKSGSRPELPQTDYLGPHQSSNVPNVADTSGMSNMLNPLPGKGRKGFGSKPWSPRSPTTRSPI